MKFINKYIPLVIELFIFALCFFSVVYIQNIKMSQYSDVRYVSDIILPTATRSNDSNNVDNKNNVKYLALDIIANVSDTKNVIDEERQKAILEAEEEKKKESQKQPSNLNYSPVFATSKVLATYSANVSHYGPDCNGCTSGYTASGYYVGKGSNKTVYYHDSTYGNINIVAADSSIPFGTILKMNLYGKQILAIVLDRGGAIGFNRKFQFDMLTANEAIASDYGVSYNTHVEVLRFGY